MRSTPVHIPRSKIGKLAFQAQSAGTFAKGEYSGTEFFDLKSEFYISRAKNKFYLKYLQTRALMI